LELYKDYAKKLIDEELSGKEEKENDEETEQLNEERPIKNRLTILNPTNLDNHELEGESKKEAIMTSSIKKKERMTISNQKVIFQIDDKDILNEEEKDNKKPIEEIKTTSHNNTLAPHIENKIRNSIKLLENDIKNLERAQVLNFGRKKYFEKNNFLEKICLLGKSQHFKVFKPKERGKRGDISL